MLILSGLKTYFQHINEGIRTTIAGMRLTLRHLWDARTRRSNNNIRENDYFNEQTGMVTLQYPFETMPIPDNGRYRLHNEMDDCIVCDKCAKVCPVDCIDIEPIKATGEVGKASDGSPIRLYAAKFDIDMAKCCYCGLCTTVCPTECLTMTKTFDYSEFDIRDMNYHYANLTPEQADEKKSLYEQFVKEKEELKKSQQLAVGAGLASDQIPEPTEAKPKPAFRPTVKPSIPKTEEIQPIENKEIAKPKPVFAPKKPTVENPPSTQRVEAESENAAKPKPVFKPAKPKPIIEEAPDMVSPSSPELNETKDIQPEPTARPKPVFKPTMKPPVVEKTEESKVEEVTKTVDIQPELPARPKPIFKPTMKPPVVEKGEEPKTDEVTQKTDTQPEPIVRPKPIFKPTMKPAPVEKIEEKKTEEVSMPIPDVPSAPKPQKENTDSDEVKPRPKPVFKPTMRPKKEE